MITTKTTTYSILCPENLDAGQINNLIVDLQEMLKIMDEDDKVRLDHTMSFNPGEKYRFELVKEVK